MIEFADKDKDGRIGFDEFVEIVTKEYPPVWWYECTWLLLYDDF